MSPEQIVTAFCEALTANDMDRALTFVSDDCVYQNMPFPPVHGPKGVSDTLLGFFKITGPVRIEVLKQAASGPYVFNERVDHFAPPTGRPFGLPVAGAFVVRDGKIAEWRDYFCMRQFAEGTGLAI